ncbi:MAG: hypothetical protein QNJ60_14615 [Xenococcaceae cyanobacterium MO_188.B19]|nr:hypothetical protein [Xenococcaceae cyanobacterium MO_188.B19]
MCHLQNLLIFRFIVYQQLCYLNLQAKRKRSVQEQDKLEIAIAMNPVI